MLDKIIPFVVVALVAFGILRLISGEYIYASIDFALAAGNAYFLFRKG